MRYSEKQNDWANDIKIRLNILLCGFIEKCDDLEDEKNKEIIEKVKKIIENENPNFIIDEYKGVTDNTLVTMFSWNDKKFCKIFSSMFSSHMIYDVMEKKRLKNEIKLQNLKDKYIK